MVDRIGFNPPNFGSEPPPERRVQFGALENEMEDEFVKVARVEKVAQVAAERKMEIPWLDYITNRFNTDDAHAFADQQYGPPGSDGEISGREFLQLLMSPEAVDPYNPPPDDERIPFDDYGVPETVVRHGVEAKGLPGYFYDDLLTLAHREGLIYELTDTENGRTYYGIPPHVREALGLEAVAPAVTTAEVTEEDNGAKEDFVKALTAYAQRVDDSGDQELREYGAELMQSARKNGLIEFDQIPDGFRTIDVDMDIISSVPDMLMTMLESTLGTDLFDDAERLAEKAVAAKILDQDLLVETLSDLRG